MQVGVIFLTICAYGLAIFLWSRERTPNYLVAMLGAHLAVLLSPLWQALYGFVYDTRLPALYGFGGGQLQALPRLTLPWPVFLGAWLAVAPALAVFYLFRHRWWFPGYATSLLTFVLFVLYHLLIETICVRQGWLRYTRDVSLPLNVPQPLLSALMNGLVSLGMLAALALSLLVHGLLGAPLYTALLLEAQSWAALIGLIGTLGLLASGAHIIAGSLERPREW